MRSCSHRSSSQSRRRGGALDEAIARLELMETEDHRDRRADLVSYATVLHGVSTSSSLSYTDRARHAEHLIERIERRGFTHTAFVTNALLDLYQYDASRVMDLLDRALEARAVDSRTFAKVARTLCWAKSPLDRIVSLVEQMDTIGIEADFHFFRSAIDAAESVSSFDDADMLYRLAENRRVLRQD